MLKLTYLSHSSFILDDGKYRLAIDPFITGNPTCPLQLSDVKVDFVVLTHAHGDHLGDALTLGAAGGAQIIAVNELANYVATKGGHAINMHIGGARAFPFGRIKFTIAHHGSSTPDGRYMGEAAGVVVTIGGRNVYHTGDTGLFLDMQLIGQRDRLDAMLLPIGDNFTMGIDDAVKAVEFADPELAIPMHYNTFPMIAADPALFKAGVETLGKKARVMKYGEMIEL